LEPLCLLDPMEEKEMIPHLPHHCWGARTERGFHL